MPEFLKRKRNIAILGCLLLLLCTICAVVAFLLLRSRQDTNLIDKQLPPVSSAQPAPMPPPPVENKPKTPITLKFPNQFSKAIYEDEGCGHQSGIVTYTYILEPTLKVGQLVISNKNLTMDTEQKQDFQDVLDVINGTKIVVHGANPASNEVAGLPLLALYTDCGGAAYYPAETFSVNYPGVDKAVVVAALGGYQDYLLDINQADLTLYLYAVKGDEIAQETLRVKVGDIFTQAEANACMVPGDFGDYVDPQCLVDNAKGSTAKLNFYKAKAVELINLFQLVE